MLEDYQISKQGTVLKLVENDPKFLLVNIIFGKNEDKSNDTTLEHF